MPTYSVKIKGRYDIAAEHAECRVAEDDLPPIVPPGLTPENVHAVREHTNSMSGAEALHAAGLAPCEHRGQWYGDREYGTTFCGTCHTDITAQVDALIKRDKAFRDERGYIVSAPARDLVAQVRAKHPELCALADALNGGLDEADERERLARAHEHVKAASTFLRGPLLMLRDAQAIDDRASLRRVILVELKKAHIELHHAAVIVEGDQRSMDPGVSS